jgi:hypothetical protein
MANSSQILGLLLAGLNTAGTGRNPIATAYHPALRTARLTLFQYKMSLKGDFDSNTR